MTKFVLILILFLASFVCAHAQEPQVALAPGKYLIVYQTGQPSYPLESLEITFEEKANMLACSAATNPQNSEPVHHKGPFIQFSVVKDNGHQMPDTRVLDVLSFCFTIDAGTAFKECRGTMARLTAVTMDGIPQGSTPVAGFSSGSCLLYKLP